MIVRDRRGVDAVSQLASAVLYAVPRRARMEVVTLLSRCRVPKQARIAFELLQDWRESDPAAYHRFLWSRHLAYAATYEARPQYEQAFLHPLRQQILDATVRLLTAAGTAPAEIRSVLDVGCSTGRILRYCETNVFPRATTLRGLDIDATAVASGVRILGELGSSVDLTVADLEQLESVAGPDAFDVVLCLGVLMYVDQESAARAVAAMLRHTRRMLVLKDIACPESDNRTLTASRVREPDGGQIHNLDAMVLDGGGQIVERWWRGRELESGLDVYVVFALPSAAEPGGIVPALAASKARERLSRPGQR